MYASGMYMEKVSCLKPAEPKRKSLRAIIPADAGVIAKTSRDTKKIIMFFIITIITIIKKRILVMQVGRYIQK